MQVKAAKKEVYKGYSIEYFFESPIWMFKVSCTYYGCEVFRGSHREFKKAQSQAKFEIDVVTRV